MHVGQIRGNTSKTEKKKLGESKRETSKVKEGRKIESEREKYEERRKIEERRREICGSETNRKMEGTDAKGKNGVVCCKQTNKQTIMDKSSCKNDSLENFVVRKANKCARERREAKMEPRNLEKKDRKTDKRLSAEMKADRRINSRNVTNESDESEFKSYRKIRTNTHMNTLRDRQKERLDSPEKDRQTHKKNVVNAESWATATTKKKTKSNTCKMYHVSSTAKEREIFTLKFWWNHDVMEKKKNRYMDDYVTSRGRDVTKKDDERTENKADNEEVGNAVISIFTNEENEARSSKTKPEARTTAKTRAKKTKKTNKTKKTEKTEKTEKTMKTEKTEKKSTKIRTRVQMEENLMKLRRVAMRRRATTLPPLKRRGTAQMKPTEDAYFVVETR